MRANMLLLIACLALLTLFDAATACGPVIHCAVAHRATRRLLATQQEYEPSLIAPAYYQLLDDVQYLDYTLAGSIFPDYLYHCGGQQQHAASEVVHWSYYQRAAIQYIHTHYGAEVLESLHTGAHHPQGEQLKQLLAFLVGVVTHSISDISWHGLSSMVDGLPSEYGLIQLIGALDFGCDGTLCEQAHDIADYGTEFIIALQRQMQLWLKPQTLQLPIDDILGIYAMLNYTTITATQLQQCHVEFQAMMLGVQRFAPYMYHTATDASPTLQEEWLHSFVGGVDDMTVQSMQGVKRFLWWLDHGVPDDLPDKWRPHASAEAAAAMQLYHQRKAVLYNKLQKLSQPITQSAVWQQYVSGQVEYDAIDAWLNNSSLLQLLLSEESMFTDSEHRFINEYDKHLRDSHLSAKLLPSFVDAQQPSTGSPLGKSVNDVAPTFDYSTLGYFGFSMSVVNFTSTKFNQTRTDVVIGAPGTGSLLDGAIVPPQDLVWTSPQAVAGAQAGYAVAAIDLNCDGVQEVVYSRPTGGKGRYADPAFTDVQYHIDGSVIVYNVSDGQSRFVRSITEQGTSSCNPHGEMLTVLPATTYDGNDLLIIGSPHAGGDFDWHQPEQRETQHVVVGGVYDEINACNPSRLTPAASYIWDDGRMSILQSWSLFGTAVAGGPTLKHLDTHHLIRIDSSPTFRERQLECNGFVSMFTYHPPGGELIVCGNGTANSKYGSALAYSPELDLLAISDINANSSAGARWSGKVYLLHNISDVFAALPEPYPFYTLSNYSGPITTISHPSAGARFGFKMLFAQLYPQNDTWSLVVSAPMYSQSVNHMHVGSVLVFNQPHLLPASTSIDAVVCAARHIVGDDDNAQFGRSLAFSPNTLGDETQPEVPALFVGSPYRTIVTPTIIYNNNGLVQSYYFGDSQATGTRQVTRSMLPPYLFSDSSISDVNYEQQSGRTAIR